MKKKLFSLFLTIFLGATFGFSQSSWQTSNSLSPVSSYRGATAAYSAGDQHNMYVFGGWSTTSGNFNETSIYNFNADSWSIGTPVPENTKGGAAACIDDGIYLLTGNDGGSTTVNSPHFLKYNVTSNTWETKADYPIAARYVAMEYNYNNGLIYCAGGTGDDYANVDAVNAYNPATDSWTVCTSLPMETAGGCALVYDGEYLWVVGGLVNNTSDRMFKGTIDANDPSVIIWVEFTACPVSIAKLSAGYIGNGQIIATDLAGTYIYDIATDTWTEADAKPIPVKGGNYATFYMGSHYTLAVAGGIDANNGIVDHVEYYSAGTSQQVQLVELNVGYQFVSSRIVAENPDMLEVLQNVLTNDLDFVRNSEGNMLRKIGPNWVNGIGDWIVAEGYLFKMFADDSFTITGTAVDPTTPIPVETGYQFVSYFPTAPMDALVAFGLIVGDDLDFIRNSQGNMLRKIGPTWVNGIGDAVSGEGYLVKMFAAGEIIYPAAAKSSGKTTVAPTHFIFEGGNAADPVYTIYIDGLEVGDEVTAFDGDILVGATKISSENLFDNSLAVFSTLTNGQGYSEGNTITLKVWNASTNDVKSVDFTMEAVYNSYVSDVYPCEDGEYSIVNVTKASSLSRKDLVVYPNPATDVINIVSNEIIKKVEILNLSGQSIGTSVENSKKITLDVSHLNSGVYLIKLYSITKIEIKKILID